MKHDLKNYGQGIKASPQVTIDLKRHKTIELAVNVIGGLIGAASVYLIIKVLFEGNI